MLLEDNLHLLTVRVCQNSNSSNCRICLWHFCVLHKNWDFNRIERLKLLVVVVVVTRGIAMGGIWIYIYPKISPSKLFMGWK